MTSKKIVKKLEKLKRRLKNLQIDIEYSLNYPWVYLDTINNKQVMETFYGNHGYTVAFITRDDFTDLKKIFKLIRMYL